ncbi:MAG: RNA pyrophosphohydrolase [Alphaproteobacteria bacterium]
MTASSTLYRPCVGIMLFNRDGLVWVGERCDTPGAWQMPQGGIDDGETPWVAALRELKEEIGTNQVERLAESSTWHQYDLPPDLIAKTWGGRFRGQRQKWFACRYTGTDAQIHIATQDREFADWRWLDLGDLTGHAVVFKRSIYQALVTEFAKFR